ncbi:MAG TPA: exosortase/archaeosortase family protein [Pirellulales bacterium]
MAIPFGVIGLVGALCLGAGLLSYWPTLGNLAATWSRVPDYSHGFLVLPMAAWFAWVRRDTCPGVGATSPLLAAALFLVSLLVRHAGDFFYFTFLDGWSLVPWTAAVIALMGGRALLMWSLPSIAFLIFMVPLPFAIEHDLSGPLQRTATRLSTALLQALGQAAFAEGNVILIGKERLEVAQACSGLRLFLGFIALTYAYVVIVRRPWPEKVVLIVACVPIAILANAVRITASGLLYQVVTDATARARIHSGAGLAMVLLAAVLFSGLLRYLRLLFKEEELMDISAVVRHSQG